MRYVRLTDADKVRTEGCGSISVTGSVRGMQKLFYWPKGGQVRIGAYIHNVGTEEIARLKQLGILRGT